jgi:hypothetical protein
VPAIAATVALLVVTRRGAYVSADSLAYVGTARSLVDGHGYAPPPGSPPLANFPPFYPLLLAGIGAFGPDPLTIARYMGPLLFGVTVLLVGLLVRQLTGSVRLAVAGQLLVASGIDFLTYHSAALSEPLFLLLALLAFLVAGASLRARGTWLVFVAALLAGAVAVTRYIGLAVILAGAAALALFGGRGRWKSAVAFTVIALAPLATWLTWVSGVEGRATNRTAVLHPPDLDYVLGGLRAASAWVVPEDVPWAARAALAGAVAVLVVVAAVRRRRSERLEGADVGLPRVLALFALAYLGALVADRWLFDVTGRLDARFLLPLHVVAIALALRVLTPVEGELSRAARLGLSAVVGLQLAAGSFWLYDAATHARVRPGGFTAPAWRQSPVIEQVRQLPPDAALFTNQVDALHFHTGRVATLVPEKAALLTGKPNGDYEQQLQAMYDALGSGGALVYFTATPARKVFLPTAEELAARLGLELVLRDEVGMLHRRPPPP